MPPFLPSLGAEAACIQDMQSVWKSQAPARTAATGALTYYYCEVPQAVRLASSNPLLSASGQSAHPTNETRHVSMADSDSANTWAVQESIRREANLV